MKYGLFSDVHANKQALEAVLDALKNEGVDFYVFLGDIVGYGADPVFCIQALRDLIQQKKCIYVAGNHDYAVCGKTNDDRYTRFAREAVDWTKKQLGEDDLEFLTSMPLVDEQDGFKIVHANLEYPQEWLYVLDIDDAFPNFRLLDKQICFYGHSHKPVVFTAAEHVDWSMEEKIPIKEGVKYLINIGSVGQPRDGNPKASFAIYDTEARLVEIRRMTYDIPSAQQSIVDSGLPPWLGERLALGK